MGIYIYIYKLSFSRYITKSKLNTFCQINISNILTNLIYLMHHKVIKKFTPTFMKTYIIYVNNILI